MRAPMMAINTVAAGGGSDPALRRRALPRRAGQRRRPARPRLLPQRRAADRDRRQCHARQGAAAALPGDLRAGGRPAARRRRGARALRRARRARSAPPPAGRRRPRHVAEGFLRVAVVQHGQRHQAGLHPEGPGRDALRPAMLRRRRRPACLPGGGRARHGDGVHPPLRRRALGLRHGPRGPEHDPRGRGGSAALGRRAWPTSQRGSTRWRKRGARSCWSRAPTPRAWRRSAGCTCATPAPTASSPCPSARTPRCWTPSPPRTASASASPRRSARWWWRPASPR